MKHEYLDGLITEDDKTYLLNCSIDQTRDRDFYTQQSFAIEETWALDFTYAIWLYTHIKAYVEYAGKIVDLTYFSVPVILNGEKIVKTQLNWCHKIIELLEEYFIILKNDPTWEQEDEAREKLRQVTYIWAEILPLMWW